MFVIQPSQAVKFGAKKKNLALDAAQKKKKKKKIQFQGYGMLLAG